MNLSILFQVQVPLKNRHAPYQIPRSPQNFYPEKSGSQQQSMGMPCQQQAMPTPQGAQQAMSTGQLQTKTSQPQVHMVQAPGMGQPAAMMYAGSSPQSQVPPRSSPMSPMMMPSPAAGLQAQSLSSPSAMHSPSTTAVCSPVPSSPSLASMRSPCSVPMRSPAHMSSGYSGHSISSPPQRPFPASDSSAAAQHCSPTSMHSPASHGSSPYTPAGMVHHVNSPPQSHVYSAPAHSPYKMDMLMDSGQGPGGQGSQGPRGQGSDPLQSLQKLVMLPEKQVVDPKSVVSDGCLQNCDEGSKNSEGPAEQSREAVDCSAGVVIAFNPPTSGDPSAVNSFHENIPAESGSPCSRSGSSSASTGQGDGDHALSTAENSADTVNKNVACSMSPPMSQGVQSTVCDTSDQTAVSASSPEIKSHEPDTSRKSTTSNADIKNISPKSCSGITPASETETDVSETTAAGSSEAGNKNTKPEKSAPAQCNGLVTLAESKPEKVNAVLSSLSDSAASLVSDCHETILEMKPDILEKADDEQHNGSPQSPKDATKTAPKPSPPKKRYSRRLSQASNAKPCFDASPVKAESQTTESDAESHSAAKLKHGVQLSDTTGTAKLVNGFSETHVNSNDSDLPVTGKRHSPKKNHVQYKSPDKQQIGNCLELPENVPEPRLVMKHKSRELVSARSVCMVTTASGPESKDLLTLCNVDGGESDSETAGQDGSRVLEHGSRISGGGFSSGTELASYHLDSDNEDDSFSNGLDFGYDSPPCEMLGDDGWKPDLEKRLSTNGVDEADGNENCTENDGDKNVNLKTKGSVSASPAKATPSPSTRVVTRSATGRAPKRRWEETNTTNTKRTRRNSGATYKQNDTMSLSMECDEIDTRESFSDVEVISSSDESGKDKSAKDKKTEDRGAQNGNQKFSEKNRQKSPVVVLTKPSSRKSQANQRRDQKPRTAGCTKSRQSSSHFYAVRGEKGRFVARDRVSNTNTPVTASVKSNSVPGMRRERGRLLSRQQANGAATSDPISVDSDSDNEPLILVQRRASKGEEGNSVTVSSSEPDRERVQSKPVQQPSKAEVTVIHETSDQNSESLFSPIPTEITSTPSHQRPGPSVSTSPARSDGSTPKKKGRLKRADGSPVANRKKSSKAKKDRKYFHRPDSADDSLKSMKFSRTLNHLQKKKGENLQSGKSFSPFVRIQGKRMMPSSVSVFNHPPADAKDLKSANKRKNMPGAAALTTVQITNFSSDKTVMLPSTKTTEASWVCALCGKRSSYRFLGDLFGPYFLESHLTALDKSAAALGKKDSKRDSGAPAEVGSAHNTRRKSLGFRRTSSVEEAVTIPEEVWIHEDCAMWSSGVYVVGSRVYGLEEALKAATATVSKHTLARPQC